MRRESFTAQRCDTLAGRKSLTPYRERATVEKRGKNTKKPAFSDPGQVGIRRKEKGEEIRKRA